MDNEERTMTWKQSITDIKVVCKRCDQEMIIESSYNDTNGILVCPKCGEHINLRVK